MMNVLLVDDEDLALDRLRKLLAPFPDVNVVGEARDGEEALQRILELRPDVVFLDIQMPKAGGLEVVRSMASPRPKIVFCTGYDQYAVEAFELHALDYLLKPVTRPRLAQTLDRLRSTPAQVWDAGVEGVAHAAGLGDDRFLVRAGKGFRVVPRTEVEYFSSEDGSSSLHTAGEQFAMAPTLNVLEGRLGAAHFHRISRAAIVNLEHVLEVCMIMGDGEVRMRSGARLPVSRRRLQALLARLGGREVPGAGGG
jgi:two-component system LytT family response regulator